MSYDFDVIVVGSGAGGGAVARRCAQEGRRVLLLERGRPADPLDRDERSTMIDKRPYDDRTIELNGAPARLYVGGAAGGGTSVYGAALLRPSRDDFHPGRSYGERLPRELWDWPVDYDELEPYYDEAERLFRVAGAQDDDLKPLETPRRGYHGAILPLAPVNRRLMEANRAAGLRPFRLPLAIDADRCLRCSQCAGFVCPTGARRSSAQLVDEAVRDGLPVVVRSHVEVERIERADGRTIDGLLVRDRSGGRTIRYRARRYVLAAGAVGSAALLLRSGFSHPQLGRNYMFHLSPIAAGLFARPTDADSTFVKQVGFADFYFGAPNCPHKLGLVQSLPAPGPLMLAKSLPSRTPARLLPFLRRRLLPLVGVVEDLPSEANRVALQGDRIVLRHRFDDYDRERGRVLGGLMKRLLRRAGAVLCPTRDFPSPEHVAHQCGTLRFGRSPRQAVVDRDGRLFEQPDLFVADGSLLPTSLGVGPSLTIVALALRTGSILSREI